MGLLTRWTVHSCVLYHICTTAVVFEGGRRGASGLQQLLLLQQHCVWVAVNKPQWRRQADP
jgi:hypothetical protein